MKKTIRRLALVGESAALLLAGVACHYAEPVQQVEENVLNQIKEKESEPYAAVVSQIASLEESRDVESSVEASKEASEAESLLQESIFESMSVAQSIAQSEAEESRSQEEASRSEEASQSESASVEESAAQSEVEASIAESQSIEASIAESMSVEASIAASIAAQQTAPPPTAPVSQGNLAPGAVVQTTPADIPMLRKLFANTVVIGDSRAKGIVDCGVLTKNEVAYYGGASCCTLMETAAQGAMKMRKKALFIVGLNDMGMYHGDTEFFKSDLKKLVASYLAINPNSQIFLQEILPVFEEGRWAWPQMDYYPAFNQAVKDVAVECGYGFVSANQYATKDRIYSADFAHYSPDFYMLWAQTIANQMGLWEDLS